jgi:hypothetical protein
LKINQNWEKKMKERKKKEKKNMICDPSYVSKIALSKWQDVLSPPLNKG